MLSAPPSPHPHQPLPPAAAITIDHTIPRCSNPSVQPPAALRPSAALPTASRLGFCCLWTVMHTRGQTAPVPRVARPLAMVPARPQYLRSYHSIYALVSARHIVLGIDVALHVAHAPTPPAARDAPCAPPTPNVWALLARLAIMRGCSRTGAKSRLPPPATSHPRKQVDAFDALRHAARLSRGDAAISSAEGDVECRTRGHA